MIFTALLIAAGILESITSLPKKIKKSQSERERDQEDWEAIRFGQDLKREDCRKNGKRKNRPH